VQNSTWVASLAMLVNKDALCRSLLLKGNQGIVVINVRWYLAF